MTAGRLLFPVVLALFLPRLAEAQPPGDAWHLEVSLVGGYEHAELTDIYDPFDWENPELPTDSNSVSVHGASGAVDLAALFRATETFAVGPFLRAGLARSGTHFLGEPARRSSIFVGPGVAWAPVPSVDLELQLRTGFALVGRRMGAGVAVGVSTGLVEVGPGQLRLGVEGSGLWTRSGEDADLGRYTYRERLAGLHLTAGLRF